MVFNLALNASVNIRNIMQYGIEICTIVKAKGKCFDPFLAAVVAAAVLALEVFASLPASPFLLVACLVAEAAVGSEAAAASVAVAAAVAVVTVVQDHHSLLVAPFHPSHQTADLASCFLAAADPLHAVVVAVAAAAAAAVVGVALHGLFVVVSAAFQGLLAVSGISVAGVQVMTSPTPAALSQFVIWTASPAVAVRVRAGTAFLPYSWELLGLYLEALIDLCLFQAEHPVQQCAVPVLLIAEEAADWALVVMVVGHSCPSAHQVVAGINFVKK